jgi:hypothetical protein
MFSFFLYYAFSCGAVSPESDKDLCIERLNFNFFNEIAVEFSNLLARLFAGDRQSISFIIVASF